MEQALAAKIRDTFLSVPLIAQYVNVEARGRFTESDADDAAITTKPRPDNSDLSMTSIIQVMMPRVREIEYSGDTHTQLDFEYPITFDLSVADEWDNSDGGLIYTNSRALFMAVYMKARQRFKRDPDTLTSNRQLGFNNCVHDYLQQVDVGEVGDEESGGLIHAAEWLLTIHVTSVVN